MSINADLAAASHAISVHSLHHYSINGCLRTLPQLHALTALADLHSRAQILSNDVYEMLYTRPIAAPIATLGRREFLNSLNQANHAEGGWDPGWTCIRIDCDDIEVSKNGLSLWAASGKILPQSHPLQIGGACSVWVGNHLSQVVPGFYLICSDRHGRFCDMPSPPRIRLYWNLTALGAVDFARVVTDVLPQNGIPFTAKVLNDPSKYCRADAGVIYLRKDTYEGARDSIQFIWHSIKGMMRDSVPMWTKKLAPGLAAAEDPSCGHYSFGQHRSFLVSLAALRSYELQHDRSMRLRELCRVFEEVGLDSDMPHLDGCSVKQYALFR